MSHTAEFPLHKAAKGSLYLVAGLSFLIVIGIPFAIFVFLRLRGAKVTVTPTGVRASCLLTKSFEFADVARFGILKVPMMTRTGGAAAELARAKLGGLDHGINIVVMTKRGKTIKILANQFANHEEMIALVSRAIAVPCEEIPMGNLGMKWPPLAV